MGPRGLPSSTAWPGSAMARAGCLVVQAHTGEAEPSTALVCHEAGEQHAFTLPALSGCLAQASQLAC